jgi:hypothetical protein
VAVCATCGGHVRPGDNFCGACGAASDVDDATAAALPAVAPGLGGGQATGLGGGQATGLGGGQATGPGTPADPAPTAPLFARPTPAGGSTDTPSGPEPGHAIGSRDPGDAAEPSDAVADAREVEVPVDEEPTSTSMDDDAANAGAPTTVIATTGGVDLVTCDACGSVNAAQRTRCARCGEVLGARSSTEDDEWELQELPTNPAEATPMTAPEATSRRRVPTWVWVVIVGILVGGGIGLATALGIGPLAAPTGPGVDFRAQAYPEVPSTLGPDLVGGSEVRPDEGNRSFAASQLLDGDPTTVWSPADPDDAVVTFRFETPVWITAIELANGDQSGPEAFEAIGRVRVAEIEMGRGQRLHATLIDGDGRQVVRFPTPALTTQVELVVSETTGGSGVALADIAIIGHDASPRDTASYGEAG